MPNRITRLGEPYQPNTFYSWLRHIREDPRERLLNGSFKIRNRGLADITYISVPPLDSQAHAHDVLAKI